MWKLIKSELKYNAVLLTAVVISLVLYSIALITSDFTMENVHDIFGFLLPLSTIFAFIYPVFLRYREKRDRNHFLLPVPLHQIAIARVISLILPWVIIRFYFFMIVLIVSISVFKVPLMPIRIFLMFILVFIILYDIPFIMHGLGKIWKTAVVIILAFLFLEPFNYTVHFQLKNLQSIYNGQNEYLIIQYFAVFTVHLLLSAVSVLTFCKRKSYLS